MQSKIKLFISDIDGTLTDGTVYYSERGEELKQFSHRDGRGFHLLHHEYNIVCVLITSESGGINATRAEKFKRLGMVREYYDGDFRFEDGNKPISKKDILIYLCKKYNLLSNEIAFIGDDTNDLEALNFVGYKACPVDANYLIKKIKGIKIMKNKGGHGAVREWIDYLIEKKLVKKN